MGGISFINNSGEVMDASIENSRILLNGPAGSGKTALLQHRYKKMIDTFGIPSESILVLVSSPNHIKDWDEKVILKHSGALWKATYYSFIEDEIKVFYPLVVKNCESIGVRDIKPVFMDFDASKFLMTRVIQWQRENRGVFSGIASDTRKIAADLWSNLLQAAAASIPSSEIGERLYQALELKDEIKLRAYREADEILQAYKQRCFELGIFDRAMSVELYTTCLMKDEAYRRNLGNRVRHLIIDNVEDCIPAEINLIEHLLSSAKTVLIAHNSHGCAAGHSYTYVRERIIDNPRLEIRNTTHNSRPLNCSSFMAEFSEMLFDNIENFSKHRVSRTVDVERVPAYELRSDMLEGIGQRVNNLVAKEGYRPSDIVVLSTYADPVTEYVIAQSVEPKGIKVTNIGRRDLYTDNELCRGLVTLAQLCYPAGSIHPGREQLRDLLRLLTDIDPVRSSIIAGEAFKGRSWLLLPDVSEMEMAADISIDVLNRYNRVREWTAEQISQSAQTPLHCFFNKAFLELFIEGSLSQRDISSAGSLISAAKRFCDSVSRFNNINPVRGFIETFNSGMTARRNAAGDEEGENSVLLATPQVYLTRPCACKVVILSSIGSRNWINRNVKELTNFNVLSGSWKDGTIYSEEMEENNNRRYLAGLIRGIIKKCGEKLITFESILSATGFENDGPLAEYFDDIFEK